MSAALSHAAVLINRRHLVSQRQLGKLLASFIEKRIGADHQHSDLKPGKAGESRLHLLLSARVQNVKLQIAHRAFRFVHHLQEPFDSELLRMKELCSNLKGQGEERRGFDNAGRNTMPSESNRFSGMTVLLSLDSCIFRTIGKYTPRRWLR
jgi:hypothetical protein